MRINRKLIKFHNRNTNNIQPQVKNIKNVPQIGKLLPISIIIPFSIEKKKELYKTLEYLNKVIGIHICEIILILYQEQLLNFNFSQFNNLNIRLVHSKRNNIDNNFCLSHARNIGIQYSRYEWVLSLDCDILVLPNLVQILSLKNNRNKNNIYWTHRLNISSLDKNDNINKLTGKVQYIDRAPFGFFHFFNKDIIIDKLGGYDESISGWGSEDDDFINRCKLANLQLIGIHKHLRVYHIIHDYDNNWKNNDNIKTNRLKTKTNIDKKNIKLKNCGIPINETIINDFVPKIGIQLNNKSKNIFNMQQSILNINNFKNKFIIFGSGPSIKELNSDKFNKLSENYSTVGFAWFYKTGLLPDYYYCHEESFRSEQCKEIIDYLKSNTKYKKTTLFTTCEHSKYIKDNHWYDIPFIEVNIKCYKNDFWDIDTKTPKLNIESLWAESLMSPKNCLFLTRTQLEATINLSYILGAKEILLHGVELTNNNHFCTTDATEGKNIFHQELKEKINFNPTNNNHCSTIQYDNCLGVQYAIKEIKKHLEKKNVKLLSTDKESLLVKENILEFYQL